MTSTSLQGASRQAHSLTLVAPTLGCMIDLGTLAGLHVHDHELHAYCASCDRWCVLDLAGLVSKGQGQRCLPIRVRCRNCGEKGVVQVRPPMPARSSTGWIAPIVPGI